MFSYIRTAVRSPNLSSSSPACESSPKREHSRSTISAHGPSSLHISSPLSASAASPFLDPIVIPSPTISPIYLPSASASSAVTPFRHSRPDTASPSLPGQRAKDGMALALDPPSVHSNLGRYGDRGPMGLPEHSPTMMAVSVSELPGSSPPPTFYAHRTPKSAEAPARTSTSATATSGTAVSPAVAAVGAATSAVTATATPASPQPHHASPILSRPSSFSELPSTPKVSAIAPVLSSLPSSSPAHSNLGASTFSPDTDGPERDRRNRLSKRLRILDRFRIRRQSPHSKTHNGSTTNVSTSSSNSSGLAGPGSTTTLNSLTPFISTGSPGPRSTSLDSDSDPRIIGPGVHDFSRPRPSPFVAPRSVNFDQPRQHFAPVPVTTAPTRNMEYGFIGGRRALLADSASGRHYSIGPHNPHRTDSYVRRSTVQVMENTAFPETIHESATLDTTGISTPQLFPRLSVSDSLQSSPVMNREQAQSLSQSRAPSQSQSQSRSQSQSHSLDPSSSHSRNRRRSSARSKPLSHSASKSSQFSFQLVNGSVQERILEERHRLKKAREAPDEEDEEFWRQDMSDYDDFDEEDKCDEYDEEPIPMAEEDDYDIPETHADRGLADSTLSVRPIEHPARPVSNPIPGVIRIDPGFPSAVLPASVAATSKKGSEEPPSPSIHRRRRAVASSSPLAHEISISTDTSPAISARETLNTFAPAELPAPQSGPSGSVSEAAIRASGSENGESKPTFSPRSGSPLLDNGDDDLYFDDGLIGDIPPECSAQDSTMPSLSGPTFDESVFDTDEEEIPRRKPSARPRLSVQNRQSLEPEMVRGQEVRGGAHSGGQEQLNQYHHLLASALFKAEKDGRFDREEDKNKKEEDGRPTPSSEMEAASAQATFSSSAQTASAASNLDSKAAPLACAIPTAPNGQFLPEIPDSDDDDNEMDDFNFDDDDVNEDDAIIAAANADALAYDDDGFYGHEFGFYSRSVGRGGEGELGGFFGPPGMELGPRRSVREPNLTPITERSEYSARNSYVSPAVGSGALTGMNVTPAGVRFQSLLQGATDMESDEKRDWASEDGAADKGGGGDSGGEHDGGQSRDSNARPSLACSSPCPVPVPTQSRSLGSVALEGALSSFSSSFSSHSSSGSRPVSQEFRPASHRHHPYLSSTNIIALECLVEDKEVEDQIEERESAEWGVGKKTEDSAETRPHVRSADTLRDSINACISSTAAKGEGIKGQSTPSQSSTPFLTPSGSPLSDKSLLRRSIAEAVDGGIDPVSLLPASLASGPSPRRTDSRPISQDGPSDAESLPAPDIPRRSSLRLRAQPRSYPHSRTVSETQERRSFPQRLTPASFESIPASHPSETLRDCPAKQAASPQPQVITVPFCSSEPNRDSESLSGGTATSNSVNSALPTPISSSQPSKSPRRTVQNAAARSHGKVPRPIQVPELSPPAYPNHRPTSLPSSPMSFRDFIQTVPAPLSATSQTSKNSAATPTSPRAPGEGTGGGSGSTGAVAAVPHYVADLRAASIAPVSEFGQAGESPTSMPINPSLLPAAALIPTSSPSQAQSEIQAQSQTRTLSPFAQSSISLGGLEQDPQPEDSNGNIDADAAYVRRNHIHLPQLQMKTGLASRPHPHPLPYLHQQQQQHHSHQRYTTSLSPTTPVTPSTPQRQRISYHRDRAFSSPKGPNGVGGGNSLSSSGSSTSRPVSSSTFSPSSSTPAAPLTTEVQQYQSRRTSGFQMRPQSQLGTPGQGSAQGRPMSLPASGFDPSSGLRSSLYPSPPIQVQIPVPPPSFSSTRNISPTTTASTPTHNQAFSPVAAARTGLSPLSRTPGSPASLQFRSPPYSAPPTSFSRFSFSTAAAAVRGGGGGFGQELGGQSPTSPRSFSSCQLTHYQSQQQSSHHQLPQQHQQHHRPSHHPPHRLSRIAFPPPASPPQETHDLQALLPTDPEGAGDILSASMMSAAGTCSDPSPVSSAASAKVRPASAGAEKVHLESRTGHASSISAFSFPSDFPFTRTGSVTDPLDDPPPEYNDGMSPAAAKAQVMMMMAMGFSKQNGPDGHCEVVSSSVRTKESVPKPRPLSGLGHGCSSGDGVGLDELDKEIGI